MALRTDGLRGTGLDAAAVAPADAEAANVGELPELFGCAQPRMAALRQTMDPRDAARVAAALADGDKDDVLALPLAGIKLTRDDALTLRPRKWLNDEIINRYTRLLMQRHATFARQRDELRAAALREGKPPPPPLRPVHIFTSFFWTKLNQVRMRGRGGACYPP